MASCNVTPTSAEETFFAVASVSAVSSGFTSRIHEHQQQQKLPAKQLRLAAAWIEIHRDELMANWALCQNGEKPFPIEPLK